MITVGTIIDVYVNVNILLIVAFGGWVGVRSLVRVAGLANDQVLALILLKILVFACFLFPILVLLFDHIAHPNGTDYAASLSLSDLVVSQYLQGSLDIKAAELDSLLGLRGRLTEEFLALESGFALVTAGLLAVGVVLGLGRLLLSLYRLHLILSKCFQWRRFGNLHLLLSDTVSTPFSTRSLFRRYIVVPVVLLESRKDLHIALSHEFQHLRQRDTEWELALEFVRPLFFWNPAFHFLKRRMEQLRELSCDQQVIARKAFHVQDYCACLLRICEAGLQRREQSLRARPTVAFVQLDLSMTGRPTGAFLRQRMLSLIASRRVKGNRLLFSLLLVPVLGLVGMTAVMMQKPDDWSQERIMFSMVINLDRLAARNQ